jgi:hypothetical protein
MPTPFLIRRAVLAVFSLFAFNTSSRAQSTGDSLGLSPVQAQKFAVAAVQILQKLRGVTLDFTPASLQEIDRFVLKLRDEGSKPETVNNLIVALGCYVGEVMVRNLDFVWAMPNEQERTVGFSYVGVRSKTGYFSNPIGKVLKLFTNGQEDSVAYFYNVVAQQISTASESRPRQAK